MLNDLLQAFCFYITQNRLREATALASLNRFDCQGQISDRSGIQTDPHCRTDTATAGINTVAIQADTAFKVNTEAVVRLHTRKVHIQKQSPQRSFPTYTSAPQNSLSRPILHNRIRLLLQWNLPGSPSLQPASQFPLQAHC